MVLEEPAESRDPAFAAREPRSPAIPAAMEVHRSGGSFYEEGARLPAPDSRGEGFPDRHARPMMAASRAPLRPYVSRSRFGFEDVAIGDQGPPIPRSRAAERRYSADLRPARWPQVHVMNVQPSPTELARPTRPSFHPMIPRRAPDFPPAVGAAGWNACFACGQTGRRLMNCAKDLEEGARDPLCANRCPACNAVGLCLADYRRRLYFAISPYPHLELDKDGASYFIRCGLPMPRWYRPELLVGPARASAPVLSNPAPPNIGRLMPFTPRLCHAPRPPPYRLHQTRLRLAPRRSRGLLVVSSS